MLRDPDDVTPDNVTALKEGCRKWLEKQRKEDNNAKILRNKITSNLGKYKDYLRPQFEAWEDKNDKTHSFIYKGCSIAI